MLSYDYSGLLDSLPFWYRYRTAIAITGLLLFIVLCMFIAFSQEIARSFALAKVRRRKRRYMKMTYAVIALDTSETRVYAGDSYSPPIPVKEGHTFGGWFVDTALSVPWKSTDRVECDITLYPKWIAD